MFHKLDGYLSKLEDPETPLDEKMKSYRNGMIRLKKVKKQMNQLHQEIGERVENQQLPPVPDDFNWQLASEQLQQQLNHSGPEGDLDQILEGFLQTRGLIGMMEQYLETQRLEIKKVNDDYEEIHLEDITAKILNLERKDDSTNLDKGVELSESPEMVSDVVDSDTEKSPVDPE